MIYNSEAVKRNAAIAQPVERILGKDEVASSNLASSSKKAWNSNEFQAFFFFVLYAAYPKNRHRNRHGQFSNAEFHYNLHYDTPI